MPRRYIVTLAREGSDRPVRFGFDLRLLCAAGALLIGTPALFVGGAAWGARAVIGDLLRHNRSLEVENASYRRATSELVAQISTLQDAADELRTRATVDPGAARAMNRLPSSITNRAMGGGSAGAGLSSSVGTVVSAVDPAFGLLLDGLHVLERNLDHLRSGVERRQALAAATPSIWPIAGWLSSTFGNRADPFTGGPDFHQGLDISAGTGEPVRATADGTVVSARASGDFGNLVVLDHEFGIRTRYGHLSRFAVAEGQPVRKGDVVGYVGSTGRATSPHLHYEVLLNGRPTDPLKLLGR